MNKFIFLISFIFLLNPTAKSQKEDKLVQFSGVVVNAESLDPLPYTTILIKNTNRGTIADYYGFFSFVAQQGDTISFTSVGFKRTQFIIPTDLEESKFSLIQVLHSDTVTLPEAQIYSWPSREQFKHAFMSLNIPDDDLERARRNMAKDLMAERFNAMPMDGSMNYRNQMQQHQSRIYYAGQAPPISLLNPAAWANFVKAWKEGDFKEDKKK
jgi:hypothetical protein